MTISHLLNKKRKSQRGGFALISVLSIIVLLAFVGVALLTLSSVRLRSAGGDKDQKQAQENAKLALMEAIGELQKTTGPDTRITAPADAFAGAPAGSTNHVRQLTGVWRSWEGLNHDPTNGKPSATVMKLKSDGTVEDTGTSIYDIKETPYDEDTPETGRFLKWLVSADPSTNTGNVMAPPSLVETANTVPLLANGSLGSDPSVDNLEVHVEKVPSGEKGSYAWWIQGNNSKALINEEMERPDVTEHSEWAALQNANTEFNVEQFNIDKSTELDKLVTLKTLENITHTPPLDEIVEDHYHDVTHFSKGLQTNAATGGWKRDLSLFSEKWETTDHPNIASNPDYRTPWGEVVSTSDLSTFNYSPYNQNSVELKGTDSYLYQWGAGSESDRQYTSMTWNSVADYASLYKNIQTQSVGGQDVPFYDVYHSLNAAGNTLTADRFTISEPVLYKLQFYLSMASQKTGAGLYVPLLGVHPNATYFNPYNVAVRNNKLTSDNMRLNNDFPVELQFELGDTGKFGVKSMPSILGSSNQSRKRIIPQLGGVVDTLWKAGEAKILGKTSYGTGVVDGSDRKSLINIKNGITDQPAYYTKIATGMNFGAAGAPAEYSGFPQGTDYSVYWVRGTKSSSVEFWNRGKSGGHIIAARRINFISSDTAALVPEKLPLIDAEDGVTETIGAVEFPDKFEPFLSMSLNMRNLLHTYSGTKGYTNKHILTSHTNTGNSTEQSAYEWQVERMNGQTDKNTLSFNEDLISGADAAGFVGTSYNADEGLARFVVNELPTQPLLSLGELQHFDPGYLNEYAPRMPNPIGNSHASALISSDDIQYGNTDGYDHSYCANHVLFDDWFVSSLAPDLMPFTSQVAVGGRSMDDVMSDFLSGSGKLRNKAYDVASPIVGNSVDTYVKDNYKDEARSWEDFSSEIVVNGMFNVNSTSVAAWASLLKSVKDARVLNQDIDVANAGAWTIQESPINNNAVFTRTSILGDDFSSGNDAQILTEPMEWTDVQLEALAEEIVEQIKLRGPFLSLSEFINRQLSTDNDLAMGGGDRECAYGA